MERDNEPFVYAMIYSKSNNPKIVISTAEQYEAIMNSIEAMSDAPAGSKEAYLRDAMQAAADEWWNSRVRRAH